MSTPFSPTANAFSASPSEAGQGNRCAWLSIADFLVRQNLRITLADRVAAASAQNAYLAGEAAPCAKSFCTCPASGTFAYLITRYPALSSIASRSASCFSISSPFGFLFSANAAPSAQSARARSEAGRGRGCAGFLSTLPDGNHGDYFTGSGL